MIRCAHDYCPSTTITFSSSSIQVFEIVSPGCKGRAEKFIFKDVENGAKGEIQELLTTARDDMLQLAIEESHPDRLVEKKVAEHEEL